MINIMSAKGFQLSVLVACAAVASGGCAIDMIGGLSGPQVKGSGRPAQETRNVDGFTKVREDGFANVDIQVGPATSVKVSGDDNIVPLVRTRVEKGELIISNKKNFHQKVKLLVSITVPNLTAVSLDGAGNITVR